ncbi:penicillin-binding protein 1C [Pseudoduganella sp. RAF19]|uniref:penicillin-binding protein 1C n=1 Tax=Pseudoduganella sp. RAF19 TaxID=3233052 RepID=UPI003F967813
MKRCAFALLLLAGAASAAPSYEQVRAAWRSSDAVLLDRHGEPLQTLRIGLQSRRQQWTMLTDISPALPLAVLEAEDQRFMQHSGVDLQAMGQAAWDNLFRKRPRGASTITMQLAAMLDPHLQPASAGGRTLSQKWDQMKEARELDAAWTKQQILEAYLNLANFRGELQGVGAAAHGLFGKEPSGLTMGESAILAALLRGPQAAQKMVARRACALAAELKSTTSCRDIEADAMLAFNRPPVMPALPPAAHAARLLLKSPGQQERSTLDANLQHYAQDVLRQQIMSLRERNVNDGAVLVLDNASGEILAYVGNAGGTEVDGVASLRQAGSTLKPFLYELALERKLITAASLMDDSPIDISTSSGLYIPQNYDREFKGYVSARTSLASSLNVPAVRTLVLVGLDRFNERLHALGFDSLTESPDYYGYSLALGSAEVTLLELANAYRTLANGGKHSPITLRLNVKPEAARAVLDPAATFVVGDVLSDRAARSLTFGLKNELAATYWAAVKTGTSKDMRDNWCIGYSTRYTVAVWVGNFVGQPMWDVSGVSGAAPVWRDVMDYLHRSAPAPAPVPPRGLVQREVRFQPAVEPARAEWFLNGTETPEVVLVAEHQRAPRILYPADASILALDPDIPQDRQRVVFEAQAAQGLQWQLNGQLLGPADRSYSWQPTPGEHELILTDGAKAIARATFHVRGEKLN